MFAVLVHIRPLDPLTNERIDVRVSSTPGGAFSGLGGFVWEAAITRRPRGTIELFSIDLSPGTLTPTADLEISLTAIQEVSTLGLNWSGAPAVIYRADALAWPAPVDVAGIVTDVAPDLDNDRLGLTITVQTDDMDVPLLVSEFSGGGGLDGEPEMRGTPKPAGYGNLISVPPLFFDSTRNIAMLDGYGNLLAVDALYESGVSLGPPVGNYIDYAALAAAIDAKLIGPGQWGTCIALGIVGLGAPPDGIITCTARFGFGMTGAMIQRMLLTHAKIPAGRIEAAAFTQLDTLMPYPAHYWTADAVQVKDIVERLAAGVNASMIVTLQNKIAVVRPFGGAAVATFRRLGFSEPPVTGWATRDTITPIWRVKARVARPARVLTLEEIRFADDIVNRGAYEATETYREGNTVWTDDGAQWLWVNAVAAAGHAPPTTMPPDANGDVTDGYWYRIKSPTTAQVAQAYKDAAPVGIGPYKKGDIVRDQGARWIFTADIAWNGTPPPALPAQANAYWTIVKDATTFSLRSNVATIVVQADYRNAPLEGQLPAVGRGILTVGTIDVSTAAAWTITTSGCTATIANDGSFAINTMVASGYVDLKATYSDSTFSTRVTTTLNAAPPPPAGEDTGPGGGGTGGPSSSITTFPTVTNISYLAAPTSTATVTATAGGIQLDTNLSYGVSPAPGGKGNRSATIYGKLVYRASGSSAGWTDASPELTGTTAVNFGYPEYEFEEGVLNDSRAVSGLTAGTVYEYGILLRKTGSNTTPYGSVTGAGV